MPRGRVLVYYEGSSNPLFEWEHPEPAKTFLPVYYYYNSEKGHAIGVAFDCASSINLLLLETRYLWNFLSAIFCFLSHSLLFVTYLRFICTGCHIENTQTDRYTRILPLSAWSKQEAVKPDKLMLMIRAKGVVLIPLLMLPATPG